VTRITSNEAIFEFEIGGRILNIVETRDVIESG
jgi:hypothetical protein